MAYPSKDKVDLVKQTFEEELGQTIDDETAEDFIRRANALVEWFSEVTSQEGFA